MGAACGVSAYGLWRRLALPSFVALTYPGLSPLQIVSDMESPPTGA